MAPTTQLIGRLEDLLNPSAFRDYCPNGLQVPGPDEVRTVVTGVSANGSLLDRAAELQADLVLAHHGLFWKGDPLGIPPLLHRRLKVLYAHDIALAAYHLPLDAHPTLGNNALLADRLGLVDRVALGDVGLVGDLPSPTPAAVVNDTLRQAVGGREPLHLAHGPSDITRIGVVTGAGTDYVFGALELGADAFITGEPAERAQSICADLGVHFFAAGHHATETFGVRALGDLLAAEFGVTHHWVDIPNPI